MGLKDLFKKKKKLKKLEEYDVEELKKGFHAGYLKLLIGYVATEQIIYEDIPMFENSIKQNKEGIETEKESINKANKFISEHDIDIDNIAEIENIKNPNDLMASMHIGIKTLAESNINMSYGIIEMAEAYKLEYLKLYNMATNNGNDQYDPNRIDKQHAIIKRIKEIYELLKKHGLSDSEIEILKPSHEYMIQGAINHYYKEDKTYYNKNWKPDDEVIDRILNCIN